MSRPKWNWDDYPCPQCKQQTLVYDGSVKWWSGPVPRELTTKGASVFRLAQTMRAPTIFTVRAAGLNFTIPLTAANPVFLLKAGDSGNF